ncbi:MAG: zf-HC2 domain-containing protein [Acidobacteriota bacterium]|nr:zf-HC2 domain-containing protein [Acidobacteriota bacterium]
MISCRSVAELLDADLLHAQNWWKRAEVRLHLAMCDACSRLARQLEQLRAAARGAGKGHEPDAGLEERLLRKLRR